MLPFRWSLKTQDALLPHPAALLLLSDAAAFKNVCRLCLCTVCSCGCSHSLFFSFLISSPLPAWIRGRRKEPPSIEVRPPPSAPPLRWWLDSMELVAREGKEAKMERKSFDLFLCYNFKLNVGTLGDRCSNKQQLKSIDGETKSRSSLNEKLLTSCPSLLSFFFFQQKPPSWLFVFYFWHSPRWEYWRRAVFFFFPFPSLPWCSSLWVYCSLNVRILEIIWPVKCGSIGNPLEGQCLGTLSISQSDAPASSQCHPLLPLLPEHSLPIFCLVSAQ